VAEDERRRSFSAKTRELSERRASCPGLEAQSAASWSNSLWRSAERELRPALDSLTQELFALAERIHRAEGNAGRGSATCGLLDQLRRTKSLSRAGGAPVG